MFEKILTEEVIALDLNPTTAHEAIRMGGELLVAAGKIDSKYIDAMIQAYETLGSYIVLAPGIAMPHARPKEHVNETSISFIRLSNPIRFNHPQNDPVHFVFCLASIDNDDHLDLLKDLSNFLSEESNINALKQCSNKDDVRNLLLTFKRKGGEE